VKTKLAAIALAVISLAGCATAKASATITTRATHPATTHIVVWSVNSDGAYFRTILTGGVGDYGPAVTVLPDGGVDPSHSSELELKLSRGSFRLSIARLDTEFGLAFERFPYDGATCSVHGSVTGTEPIVAGSGTGAYRGIAGSFALTISVDEVDVKKSACNETTPFQAQLLLIEGTGHLS
jgi:hypothetical protein